MSRGLVVLAGGSGFLGRVLSGELERAGYEVLVLTRRLRAGAGRQAVWDGRSVGEWARLLEGAEAVVNLAGRSVNCRYTRRNRKEIVESRVRSVEALGRAVRGCARPPKLFVQVASLAIYGDAGRRVCCEDAPAGRGFSAETCAAWERAFDALELPSTRKVLLRTGLVLGRAGGALATLARLARFYLGGTVGDGRQYLSWLHERDFARIVRWCLEREGAAGVYNATGPAPVTNAEFMCELRCALKRPWSPRTPAPLVRLGAWLMRTEAELALAGRRALPDRLVEEGFKFMYTNLETALADIFQKLAPAEAAPEPRPAAPLQTRAAVVPAPRRSERAA
jgi:uncharacterized protein (TIGR01777 family)